MAEPSNSIPHARYWNIALRTAHIAVTGVLVGGHVFGIGVERLVPWLYLTVATGSGLIVLEAYPNWRWCCQVRGTTVIVKLLLTSLVAWLWDYRVFLLMSVVVLGSVASHMPGRFRHRSLADFLRLSDPPSAESPGSKASLRFPHHDSP